MLAASEQPHARETFLDKVERLATLDKQKQDACREATAEHYYAQFSFQPKINARSKRIANVSCQEIAFAEMLLPTEMLLFELKATCCLSLLCPICVSAQGPCLGTEQIQYHVYRQRPKEGAVHAKLHLVLSRWYRLLEYNQEMSVHHLAVVHCPAWLTIQRPQCR